MVERIETDLAVIGAGPAGQKGAIQAAKVGRRALVVDRLNQLGGACLNQGTIPSKTLREAILDFRGFCDRSSAAAEQISIEDLDHRVRRVVEDQNCLIARQFDKNDIRYVSGAARFIDRDTMTVCDDKRNQTHEIRAERFLVATGSRPRNPGDVPFDQDTILDSDRLLRLKQLPQSMLVLGGGVIGSEYATMFAALGTAVILIDRADRPLSHLDAEVGRKFGDYIEAIGVQLQMGRTIVRIGRGADGGAEAETTTGEVFRADCLFYALGRQANVEELGLERAGVNIDENGYIAVNALFESDNPRVYGAGDVIGRGSLASIAMEQGRLAVRNAFSLKTGQFPEFFPYGIYTIPEVAGIGPTQEELENQGVHFQVGLAYYYELGRGPIAGDSTGMFKLIFHAETLEVLAVHIIGTNATELVHIGQVAIDFHARAHYFIDQIFNYPTFAEGYRVAALNGLNKLAASRQSYASE
ncbi:MAG: Si-specific NAD(P)(+) transhydrogenase [Candidatus Latescibacterota bacterium]|nr:Si-specific NAD(P)(+) transhydrogenase [Candidatus Latescibacterota bacterium]